MRFKVIFFAFFYSLFTELSSQELAEKPNNYFMFHVGCGTSSLQGWSAFASFSFERKNNEFTLRGIFNNQFGNRKKDFIGFDVYNDHFGDVAVLYGRTFRKNYFFASFSAGPSLYEYADKFLVKQVSTNNWLTNDYVVNQKYYSGIGLACESKLIALVAEDVGVGALFWCDINNSKSIAGASIALTFGYLRD